MLVFLGGLAASAISGRFDIFGPLIMAGEVTYLAALGTHPKFQKAVDAAQARTSRQDGVQAADAAVRKILDELPKAIVRRFEDLRSRCTELRKISLQMREPISSGDSPLLDDVQIASLDRLLWMYLRLLYTQYALTQFLQKTSDKEINADINLLNERLKSIPAGDERQQRVRKVIEDNLQTSRSRLENYRKAQENHELMGLEIDRLENTIHSLSELAVNRQEPNFISGQIDQVAASMVQTEKTMGELQFVTGLHHDDEDVPSLLRSSATVQER
jgi:hypothetical protein